MSQTVLGDDSTGSCHQTCLSVIASEETASCMRSQKDNGQRVGVRLFLITAAATPQIPHVTFSYSTVHRP